jgi:hypothetical protein
MVFYYNPAYVDSVQSVKRFCNSCKTWKCRIFLPSKLKKKGSRNFEEVVTGAQCCMMAVPEALNI